MYKIKFFTTYIPTWPLAVFNKKTILKGQGSTRVFYTKIMCEGALFQEGNI